MKLKVYSYILSSVFAISIALSAITLVLFNQRLTHTSELLGQSLESVRAAEELQIQLLSHNRESFLLRMDDGSGSLTRLIEVEEEVYRWLDATQDYINSVQEKALVEKMTAAVISYLEVRRDLLRKDLPPSESYLAANTPLRLAHQLVGELTDLNLSQARDLKHTAVLENRRAATVGIFIGLFCLVAFPLLWLSIRKSIYTPVERIHRMISRAENGSTTGRTEMGGLYEINQIGSAFQKLLNRLDEEKKNQLRFLAGVAHDLRNPLNAIHMSAQVLNDENIPKDEQKTILEIISKQASNLDRMVGDFLDSTRIEAGQLEIKKNLQCLSTLVIEAATLHKQTSTSHQISMEIEPEIYSDCDPLRISQVLNNLLHNAIKYSPDGGEVKVSLRAFSLDMAAIEVSDSGIGIEAEEIQQIFEPFKRTKRTKEIIPGVGLGLSVARKIILAHGGSIEVHSQPGKGSKFRVLLPCRPRRLAIA